MHYLNSRFHKKLNIYNSLMLLLYVIIPVFGRLERSLNNENDDNSHYYYNNSNKVTIMRCRTELFLADFGSFRRILVIRWILVFLVNGRKA